MFVRVKKIKGNEYAYLVENEWTPWGSRQKITKYIGRAHTPKKIAQHNWELPEGYKEAAKKAIMQELTNHGFEQQGEVMRNCDIEVNLNENKIMNKGKRAALAMNEGYLCEDTIKQLIEFTPEENREKSATKLATLTLETGLKLSTEQMLKLFEEAHKLNKQ